MGPRVLPTTITLVHVCSLSTSFLKVRLDKFKPYTLATYRPAVVIRALGVLTAEVISHSIHTPPVSDSIVTFSQGGAVFVRRSADRRRLELCLQPGASESPQNALNMSWPT